MMSRFPLLYACHHMTRHLSVLGLAILPLIAAGTERSEPGAQASPYAGQQSRAIKSLSADDLAELRRGGGWGLARAAELNGVPGPKHLLELRDEIPLSEDQVEAIQAIFDRMQTEAIEAGQRFIEAERALEAAFQNRSVDAESLHTLLDDIARHRSALRFAHLHAHLETLPLLSDEQLERYSRLRGYGETACDEVPEGHDPALWRRHHGCD